MGLINNVQQRPIPSSLEDQVKKIKADIYRTYQFVKRVHQKGMTSVWNNPNYTPEEIFAALGTDAEEAVKFSALLANLITQIEPTSVINVPADKELVMTGDGTVTINTISNP